MSLPIIAQPGKAIALVEDANKTEAVHPSERLALSARVLL